MMSELQVGCFSRLSKLSLRRLCRKDSTNQAPKNVSVQGIPEASKDAVTNSCSNFGTCCTFSNAESDRWSISEKPPSYSSLDTHGTFRPEVVKTIEAELDRLSPELRSLSLKIHGHPELKFEERYAHDVLTDFMQAHGFAVTKHYLLDTAWRAEFSNGKGGRVLGVNSEMDALPGIGHACGHNLIAISGVGVALAVKAALEAHDVPGKVVLLGTPGEEGGSGKSILIQRGGYKDMDACIMCHPGPGPAHSAGLGGALAMLPIEVEFFGQTAHAGKAPWEGTNALDAAFLAYSSVAVLRQQIKPTHRVHGIVEGRNWAPNVIPDYAKMTWYVRAPTRGEMQELSERVTACFEAAALATSCQFKIAFGLPVYDIRQNEIMANEFADIIQKQYGMTLVTSESMASTDFGNVTYEMPGLHPHYAIPTQVNGGNHTPAFTESAGTPEAHDACMATTKALALTGFHILDDDTFFKKTRKAFEDDLKRR